jgi:hypothetical protein
MGFTPVGSAAFFTLCLRAAMPLTGSIREAKLFDPSLGRTILVGYGIVKELCPTGMNARTWDLKAVAVRKLLRVGGPSGNDPAVSTRRSIL